MSKIGKTTLPNGLRIVTSEVKGTRAATLLVLYGVGSRFEKREIGGISHFLEHMMFKGTKKRPSTVHISKDLDKMGADYNAFTGYDYTGYYIKSAKQHLPKTFDILSDMLQHSNFSETEIKRERNVIVEEIRMYHDNPMSGIYFEFSQLLFSGNPLGWDIAGSKKTVMDMSRAKLKGYYQDFYLPQNTVIAVAGDVSHAAIEKLVRKNFHFKKQEDSEKAKPFKISQKEPRSKIIHRKTQQIQLALGVPAYSYTDKRGPALEVLDSILRGGMGSRLFINVRERKGLCYYIRSHLDSFAETGSFMIQAGLNPKKIEEAVKAILKELKDLKTKPVGATELNKVKGHIKGKHILSSELSDNVATWIASKELFTGKPMSYEEHFRQIDKVTPGEIKEVAKDLFKGDLLNLVIMGQQSNNKRFQKILESF